MKQHNNIRLPTSKDRLLVVDLEATCTETNEFSRREMEIIEVGAVLVDRSFNILDAFQSFVRPVRNSKLTAFCRRLTKITQEDVDQAPGFVELMGELQKKFDLSKIALATWGNWDEMKWKDDCKYHGINYPFKEHINLKEVSKETMGLYKFQGIANTLYILDMDFEGQQHRGIDDAFNIVRIFQKLMGRKIDNSLSVQQLA